LKTHFVTKRDFASLPPEAADENVEVIWANTKYPERNRELTSVYDTHDIPDINGKKHYFGFTVVQLVDIRYAVADGKSHYRAYLHGSWDNILVFEFPAYEYSLKRGADDLQDWEEQADFHLMDAIDSDHHEQPTKDDTEEYEKRSVKKILLVFPKFVKLSAQGLYEHDDDDNVRELRPAATEIFYEHDRVHPDPSIPPGTKQKDASTKVFFYWNIARLDYKGNKYGRAIERDTNYSRQAMLKATPSKNRAKYARKYQVPPPMQYPQQQQHYGHNPYSQQPQQFGQQYGQNSFYPNPFQQYGYGNPFQPAPPHQPHNVSSQPMPQQPVPQNVPSQPIIPPPQQQQPMPQNVPSQPIIPPQQQQPMPQNVPVQPIIPPQQHQQDQQSFVHQQQQHQQDQQSFLHQQQQHQQDQQSFLHQQQQHQQDQQSFLHQQQQHQHNQQYVPQNDQPFVPARARTRAARRALEQLLDNSGVPNTGGGNDNGIPNGSDERSLSSMSLNTSFHNPG
jgi:hypothetical protein